MDLTGADYSNKCLGRLEQTRGLTWCLYFCGCLVFFLVVNVTDFFIGYMGVLELSHILRIFVIYLWSGANSGL